jgi:hypothetical protein
MERPAVSLRSLLAGGDRRSVSQSERAREVIEQDPARVADLAALTGDDDWLVVMRACDLLEKLAHAHPDLIAPHKRLFIGPLADSDKWEIRLQIVRVLPLFKWTATQRRRVEEILLASVTFPQTFVRAWALDGLATLSQQNAALKPVVERRLREFARSESKALQARARAIRQRLAAH